MNDAVPVPLISLVVHPKRPDDADRLTRALRRLTAEDRDCSARAGGIPGEVVISGTSENHLETIIDRLKRDFDVAVTLSLPEVVYREALTRSANGENKYARQGSSGGEYAHVKIRLHPRQPGAGYMFENHVEGGAVPASFIPAVAEGIEVALSRGAIAGYAIHDVRAELYDGSYHDVGSSAAAFRIAAALATEAAVQEAEPVLLEPVMRVEVAAPADAAAVVIHNLVARRGRVRSHEESGDTHLIQALVPLAELFGYATDFRSRTLGRGTCSIRFEAFEQVQRPDEDEDGAPVGVPRPPNPRRRDSGIALPEPDYFDPEA